MIIMDQLAEKIKGQVNNMEFIALNNTYMSFPPDQEKLLTDEGKQEMLHMGRRFAMRWRSLWQNIDESEMAFSNTEKPRTKQSGHHFGIGFSAGLGRIINKEIVENNNIIRYYNLCPLHQLSVEDNQTTMQEYIKFQTGPELTSLPSKITAKLHMKPHIKFDLGEI